MNAVLAYVITAVAAYLLGSISTGILLSRVTHGPNLREVGSKNTGASNVLRTMGVRNGLVTFLGDFGKAALACLVGRWLLAPYGASLYGAMLAGLVVIIGHNWPMFFQFKGGKGVASSCGVMLVCFPIPALVCFMFTILLIWLSKYISLGSMAMLTLFAILVTFQNPGNWLIIVWSFLLAVMCVVRHRGNIKRLLSGTENRLGDKKKAAQQQEETKA